MFLEANRRSELQRLESRFDAFLREAWKLVEPGCPLKWSWVLDALCAHLQAVAEGKIQKLLINIPPGTGKSTIVSVIFPCWLWVRRPETKVMCASHGGGLALRDALKRRDLILGSPWFKERWGDRFTLSESQATKTEFANTRTGFMFSTSVNGDVLGRRGEVLILDDPHKTQGAESEVERANTTFWLNNEWSTRRNRDATLSAEICVMQRLHEMDASGLFLSQKGWTHLRLPMFFESEQRCSTSIGWSDPRKEPGEVLDPARFSPDILEDLQTRLGPYGVAGQLQQRPAPASGGIIKRDWIKTYRQPTQDVIDAGGSLFNPMHCFRFATVDLAVTSEDQAKKGKDPDYTVITSWVFFHGGGGTKRLCVLDMFRKRIEGPDIETEIALAHARWKFAFIAVEQIAGFIALGQSLKRSNLPIRDIGTSKEAFLQLEGDKVSRCYGATPFLAQHGIYIPEYAPWGEALIKECTTFPLAAHDDVTDTVTSAVAILQQSPELSIWEEILLQKEAGGLDPNSEAYRRKMEDAGYNMGDPEDLDDPRHQPPSVIDGLRVPKP